MGKNLKIFQNCSGGLNIEFYGLKREHSHPWGQKWGVGPKIFILAQILRGVWPKTSKNRIWTFFTIKSIIFELRSKFLELPLCFRPHGYPCGWKHRDRSKNFDPSSNIMDFMVKNVKMWILDVLGHKNLNIWARINILDLPPIFDPKDDCVNVLDLKNQYLSLQRDFGKFRDFSLLNPI